MKMSELQQIIRDAPEGQEPVFRLHKIPQAREYVGMTKDDRIYVYADRTWDRTDRPGEPWYEFATLANDDYLSRYCPLLGVSYLRFVEYVPQRRKLVRDVSWEDLRQFAMPSDEEFDKMLYEIKLLLEKFK